MTHRRAPGDGLHSGGVAPKGEGSGHRVENEAESNGEGHHVQRGRIRVAVTIVFLAGALSVSVLTLISPIRQLLGQAERIDEVRRQAGELDRLNAKLEARIEQLSDDSEVERLARAELGLVKPGEEAYLTLPGQRTGDSPPLPVVVKLGSPGG